MKKTYISPALAVQFVQTENIIALSMQDGKADSSDALVKEEHEEEQEQHAGYRTTTVEWEQWDQQQ